MSKDWINRDGRIAHPDSPVGGCGPGHGRIPKPLGNDGGSQAGLPHPDSHWARLHSHQALEVATRMRAKRIPRVVHKLHLPTSPIPQENKLREARIHIMNWVASEKMPQTEWERMQTANPNTPEHNFKVTYTVNYVFEAVGIRPNKTYSPKHIADFARKALWTLTSDLRRADEHVNVHRRIGTSESLFLRDAQRYLYGLQGATWLQKHIENQYHIPSVIAEHSSGETIDGIYNFVKKDVMFINASIERITGTSPGFLRTGAKLPLSRPGGDAWFNLGASYYAALNPPQKTAHAGNPLLTSVPTF